MKIKFEKYQATGNDFVIIDKTIQDLPEITSRFIQQLCDRRFGIGADGVIFIDKSKAADFDMFYYNADGTESFCGNGSRAAVRFAKENGLLKENELTFSSNDGMHNAVIAGDKIKINMHDVKEIVNYNTDLIIDTGSPHYIKKVEDTDTVQIIEEGRKIRNSKDFIEDGINVNFIQSTTNSLKIRTYERGVEAETLSCGTGVTACALATTVLFPTMESPIETETKGGRLKIYFDKDGEAGFKNIWLEGPAECVFKGTIKIQ